MESGILVRCFRPSFAWDVSDRTMLVQGLFQIDPKAWDGITEVQLAVFQIKLVEQPKLLLDQWKARKREKVKTIFSSSFGIKVAHFRFC